MINGLCLVVILAWVACGGVVAAQDTQEENQRDGTDDPLRQPIGPGSPWWPFGPKGPAINWEEVDKWSKDGSGEDAEGGPVVMEHLFDAVVLYTSVEDSAGRSLRVLVTAPEELDGPAPALLIVPEVTGGEPAERAGGGNDLIWTMVELATAAGFVTARVELHGVGDSEGPASAESDLADTVDALASAFDSLGRFEFVDADRRFVFAQGFGATAAALMLNEREAAGVCAYGAPSRDAHSTLMALHERAEALDGTEWMERAERAPRAAALLGEVVFDGVAPADAEIRRPELRHAANLTLDVYAEGLLGRSAAFWRQMGELAPMIVWSRVKAPRVLALEGEFDWRVGPGHSWRIVRAVGAGADGAPRGEGDQLAGLGPSGVAWTNTQSAYDGRDARDADPRLVARVVNWMLAG